MIVYYTLAAELYVALRKEFVDRPEFPESYSFAANYTRNTNMVANRGKGGNPFEH